MSTGMDRAASFRSKDNGGIIIVSREFDNICAPYYKQRVPNYLERVNHKVALGKKAYKAALAEQEEKFNLLVRQLEKQKRSLIVVLQGRDGSGKTGARVRIEQALDNDAKIFQAVSIGPPSEDERAHGYLWRFLTGERLPRFGQVRVFDRSWAERLLVEPVMGFAGKGDVQKSYAEIRSFEWLLTQQGAIVVKFWMDISRREQKKRFHDRAKDKPWKLSDSDNVARKHWKDYTRAANEMFLRTGTDFAPWHIISSEDKLYSRVNVLHILNDALRAALGGKPLPA